MTRLTRKEKSLSIAMILLIVVLILITLSSCGPAHHLRKSEKHLKKAVAKGAVVKPDTVFKTIEVITPKIKFDTVLRQVNFRDTITVEKDKVITRIKYDTVSQTIFVQTECPPDTVYVKTAAVIKNEITCPPKDNKWKWIAIALGVAIALVMRR
jgi:hypothetical protein